MKRLLSAALAFAALASVQAGQYYWKLGKGEFADFATAANWSNATQTVSTTVPGATDTLYGLCHQAFDLGGATRRVAGWSTTGDWESYYLELQNGTLEVADNVTTHNDKWSLGANATIRFLDASTYCASVWAGAADRIQILSGGRFETFGTFKLYNLQMTVETGGTAVIAPASFTFPNGTAQSSWIANAGGTLSFPNGLAPSGVSVSSGFSFAIRQTAGTLDVGGPISDAGESGTYSLELSGGTVRTTADASLGFGSASVAAGASVTFETATDTTLDASALSYGAGATVRKTGAGALAVGAALPSSLAVDAGTLRLIGTDAACDLSGVSFAEGTKLEITAPGLVLNAPNASIANAALVVALDWATNGQIVAVCPDEGFAKRLAEEAGAGLAEGFALEMDGHTVKVRVLPVRVRGMVDTVSFEDGMETFYTNPGCGLAKGGWVDLDPDTESVQNLAGNKSHMWCLRKFSKGYVYDGDEDLFRTNVSQYVGGQDIEITDTAISSITRTLDTCRANGGTVVLRFAYTKDRYGGTECDDFDMVIRHIGQIGEALRNYGDVILAVECGIIGAWGEMHTSRYQDAEHGNRILAAWLDKLPASVPLLVRAPKYFIWYFDQTTGDGFFSNIETFDQDVLSRIGMFNDGYIGSWSDVGTWGESSRHTYFSREQGRALLARNPHLPYGGEFGIVDHAYFNGNSGNAWQLLDTNHWNMVEEWYDTHLSYLRTIESTDMTVYQELADKTFTTAEFAFPGMPDLHEYNNADLRKFCGDHMGARFVIRGLNVPDAAVTPGAAGSLDATIENTGFGMLAFPSRCDIVFTKGNVSIAVPATPTKPFEDIQPKESADIAFAFEWPELVAGNWDVSLRIRVPLSDETGAEPLPRRYFRVANEGAWNADIRAQRLCTVRLAPETAAGIPYAWFIENGLANMDTPAAEYETISASDEDGDGQTNGQEYIGGTNPLDASSHLVAYLSFDESGKPVVTPAPPPPADRVVTIESTGSLHPTAWAPDDGTVPDAKFYRVKVKMP